ncbi:threonine--tRNA ligase, partial [Candidatus Dojkabacteria bacterium]|nr:threonine--tRNA ligase [Candidatus Dojkabacteria bacterium]
MDSYKDFKDQMPDWVRNEQDFDLYKIRHSTEHIFNQAVEEIYSGKVTRAMGPAIQDGWYNDSRWEKKISEEEFADIEKRMQEIIDANLPFVRKEVSESEAREMFGDNPFKQEFIDEFVAGGGKLSVYYTGEPGEHVFVDLCRGPHVSSTGEIKAFKLLSVAGAYWRGDEKNEMLTRIYGTAFATHEELDKHLENLEEAKKRDHRKLGRELELFHFEEEIGPGLPIWLPKGNVIKEALEKWAKETEREWGYERVTTPVITKENLFYTSGHLPLYKDSMYAPIEIEKENYYLKPMNCPFHHKVFSSKIRSYRELPLRVAEYGLCHRYEDSGSLFGLMRVRGMDMNDAHIYVPLEDAVGEFLQVIKLHEYYYQALGVKEYEMELALRNPDNMDKYHGSEEDWQLAEKMTIEAMEKSGVPYKIVNDGAAFYGPKMDFQIKSSIGRMFTASTNQLDLYMGKRFNLEYIDKDGKPQVPAIIHRAPLGTHERFIGFLIEHFGGAFPAWLSPEQVRIIPISADNADYAGKVRSELFTAGVQVSIDDSDDRMGNKIRKAQEMKVPYMLIVGKQEAADETVSVRLRSGEEIKGMKLAEFKEKLLANIAERKLEL